VTVRMRNSLCIGISLSCPYFKRSCAGKKTKTGNKLKRRAVESSSCCGSTSAFCGKRWRGEKRVSPGSRVCGRAKKSPEKAKENLAARSLLPLTGLAPLATLCPPLRGLPPDGIFAIEISCGT
jgi:hypothetical protein